MDTVQHSQDHRRARASIYVAAVMWLVAATGLGCKRDPKTEIADTGPKQPETSVTPQPGDTASAAPQAAPQPDALQPAEGVAKLASLMLVGCEDKHYHEGGQGRELTGLIAPGPRLKGVFPIGFRLDAKTADGKPVHLQVKDGALSAPAGVDLTKLLLVGVVNCPGKNKTVDLGVQISKVRSDPKLPNDSAIQEYSVRWESAMGPAVCDASLGPNWAVPTPGLWKGIFGTHEEDPAMFTFACEGAVVAKCYDEWDYRPWTGKDDAEKHLRTQLHSACTRAARAAYCGGDRSFTEDGTIVDIWDGKYVLPSTKLSPDYTFESAWSETGAVCKQHVRWGKLTGADAGTGACADKLDPCADEAAARKLGGTKPLVFVRSCGPDPCKCQPCLCSPGGCADGGAPPVLPHP